MSDREMRDLLETVIDDIESGRVELCSVLLGSAHRLHWGLPDPVIVEGDGRLQAFRDVREELRRRLTVLLAKPHCQSDKSIVRSFRALGDRSPWISLSLLILLFTCRW